MRLLGESIRYGVGALLVWILERRALNYQCVVWFMENNWTCKRKNDEGSVCHDPGLTFLQLYDWVGSNPSIWTWSLEDWSREMTPAINICHYTLEGTICLAKGVLLDSIQGKKGHLMGFHILGQCQIPVPRALEGGLTSTAILFPSPFLACVKPSFPLGCVLPLSSEAGSTASGP